MYDVKVLRRALRVNLIDRIRNRDEGGSEYVPIFLLVGMIGMELIVHNRYGHMESLNCGSA